MISISKRSLQVISVICACLNWQLFAHAEDDSTKTSAATDLTNSTSTVKKSDAEVSKIETVGLFFDQVNQIQGLPKFTKESITGVTGLPVEYGSASAWYSRGKGTDTLDRVEIAHDREDLVTAVTLVPAKSLRILSSDIKARFGTGKTSKPRACYDALKSRHGYETMFTVTYKKSGLTTQFDLIKKPKEGLYSVSLFR